MCFSAQASFTAAAFIGTIGIASVARAKPSLRLLALTPIFFALQQGVESILWLTLESGDPSGLLNGVSTYLFLIFAILFWPLWIPAVLYGIEKNPRRKGWLQINGGIGCFLALLSILWLVILGASSEIIHHHIHYTQAIPSLSYLPSNVLNVLYNGAMILYFWTTIGSFFISSLRGSWLLGALLAASYGISFMAFSLAFTSVWCFFGAWISLMTFFMVRK